MLHCDLNKHDNFFFLLRAIQNGLRNQLFIRDLFQNRFFLYTKSTTNKLVTVIQDFLPFVCQICRCSYCAEHRFADSHGCSNPDLEPSNDIICRACNQIVTVPKDADAQAFISIHIQSGCKTMSAASEMRNVSLKIVCLFEGCSNREFFGVKCAGCRGLFCLSHRHATSHKCPQLKLAEKLRQQRSEAISQFLTENLGSSASKSDSSHVSKKKPRFNPKVALMKLKLNAKGDANILPENKVFVRVLIVDSNKQHDYSLYFHKV